MREITESDGNQMMNDSLSSEDITIRLQHVRATLLFHFHSLAYIGTAGIQRQHLFG